MILGVHMKWVTKIIGKNAVLSTGVSNFPAGFESLSYNGHKGIDASFTTGMQSGCAGKLQLEQLKSL